MLTEPSEGLQAIVAMRTSVGRVIVRGAERSVTAMVFSWSQVVRVGMDRRSATRARRGATSVVSR